MSYRLLADMLVVFHLAVVAFVIAGAALVVWRKWIAWIHLPVVVWVIFAECFQVLCPLTYLENWLRDRGGAGTYRGDFVAHYIMPVLYPNGLTARIQLMFGVMVFAINATLYAWAFWRHKGVRGQFKSEPEVNTGEAPLLSGTQKPQKLIQS